MDFPNITISYERKAKDGSVAKSRCFDATLLTFLTADRLWPLGQAGQAMRPVWITYAAPHEMGRAFTANFRGGLKAKVGPRYGTGNDTLELPKSSPHRWLTQRCDGRTTVTTAYLPELFELDPGQPEDCIGFVFMPSRVWLESQTDALTPEFGDDAIDVARGALFAAFLDRRSPLPLVNDLRFHLQLYRAAVDASWTHEPKPRGHLIAVSPDACGLDEPRLVHVTHSDFETFLKSQTAKFFHKEIADGKNRLRPNCRILPFPQRPPEQLRLLFEVA